MAKRGCRGESALQENGESLSRGPWRTPCRPAADRVNITIYNDADFRGFSAVTGQSIPDLRAWQVQGYNNKSWNNRISSMRLN